MTVQSIEVVYNGRGEPLTLSSYELGTTADQSITQFVGEVPEGDTWDIVFDHPMQYLLCGKETNPFIRFIGGAAVVPGAIMARIRDDHVNIYVRVTHSYGTVEASAPASMHVVTLENTPVESDPSGMLLIRGSTWAWQDGTRYDAGAVVEHDTRIWLAIEPSEGIEPSDGSDYWAPLATGVSGVSSVNGKAGTVVLTPDDLDDTDTVQKFVSAADKSRWDAKQDQLVSGTNIKTINGQPVLGSGDIEVATEAPVQDVYVDGQSVLDEDGIAQIVMPTIPVTDVEVNGSSVVSGGVAEITIPSIPSDIERTTNKSTSFPSTFSDDTKYPSSKSVQSFVNSSVQTATAFFDGAWTTWASVPTTVEGFTSEGLPEPGPNNYLVVKKDEEHDDQTWRYKYVRTAEQGYAKSGWNAEYMVNETPLTDAQIAALNSGITAGKVAEIDNKRDKVTTANRLYSVNASGEQASVPYGSDKSQAWTIPQRNASGELLVPTPSSDDAATPKTYVDGGLGGKVDKSNTAAIVYGTDLVGSQKAIPYSPSNYMKDTLISRDVYGYFKVQDPYNSDQPASKGYVDTALQGKQNTLTAGTGITIENNVISASNVGHLHKTDIRTWSQNGLSMVTAGGSGDPDGPCYYFTGDVDSWPDAVWVEYSANETDTPGREGILIDIRAHKTASEGEQLPAEWLAWYDTSYVYRVPIFIGVVRNLSATRLAIKGSKYTSNKFYVHDLRWSLSSTTQTLQNTYTILSKSETGTGIRIFKGTV